MAEWWEVRGGSGQVRCGKMEGEPKHAQTHTDAQTTITNARSTKYSCSGHRHASSSASFRTFQVVTFVRQHNYSVLVFNAQMRSASTIITYAKP